MPGRVDLRTLVHVVCLAGATTACHRGASPLGGEDGHVAPSAEPPVVDASIDVSLTPSVSASAGPAEPDAGAESAPPATFDTLLPAIDADGGRVLALLPREMGARGVDGLAMVVKDVASDREIEEFTLRGPNESGVRIHDGGAPTARALLGGGVWARILPAAVGSDQGAPRHRAADDEPTLANLAQSGDVVVRYREPVVEVRRGTSTALSRPAPGWSAASAGSFCGRPWASIEEAWIDTSRSIAVVRIDYHGPSSDLCWLPDPTIHVVRW